MGLRKRRFARRRDGGIRLWLAEDDRHALHWIVPQLRDALLESAGALGEEPPAHLRRLFPVAHANDPEAEAEYRSLMGDELLRKRLDALDEVEATIDAPSLTEEQADLWIGVVNDLRLVLGTALDVSEDDDRIIDPDDPDAASRWAYQYLTVVLGELIDARSGW